VALYVFVVSARKAACIYRSGKLTFKTTSRCQEA
jgi:hypothetical protein